MKIETKTLLKKIGLWLILAYVFGYFTGFGMMVAFLEGFDYLELFLIGFIFSGLLTAITGPIFILLVFLWLRWIKKNPALDKNWTGIILFSLCFGGINGGVLNLIIGENLKFLLGPDSLFFIIGFLGGFVGVLLPRILIPSLRPGNLLKNKS